MNFPSFPKPLRSLRSNGQNAAELLTASAKNKKEQKDDLYGQVLWGANNIFSVLCEDGHERKCRLRGKTLEQESQEHNSLVCGDFVLLDGHSLEHESGQIYRRIARHNILRRRNLKRGEPQAFAANVDSVILMVSWMHPPLRTAFLDRLLIAAQQTQVPIQVLINKVDCIRSLRELWQFRRHLQQYRDLGIAMSGISLQKLASTKKAISQNEPFNEVPSGGKNWNLLYFLQQSLPKLLLKLLLYFCYILPTTSKLQKLYHGMHNKLYVILGASGVGKSTLCNYFFPNQPQETRAISEKWQRGVHTTTLARILANSSALNLDLDVGQAQARTQVYRLIDTPGMRNFLPEIDAAELQNLQNYYPEFRSLRKNCAYSGCQHRQEPDCAVREAAEYELVPRYQSYLNLYDDLEESLAAKPIYQTQAKKEGKKDAGKDKGASPRIKGIKGQHGENTQIRSKERKRQRSKVRLETNSDGSFSADEL